MDSSIGSLLAAWADLDRLLGHVTDEVAVRQPGPGRASVAWTIAHLANQADAWLNVEVAGAEPHLFASDARWTMGGDGLADDWPAVRRALDDVRSRARTYLL